MDNSKAAEEALLKSAKTVANDCTYNDLLSNSDERQEIMNGQTALDSSFVSQSNEPMTAMDNSVMTAIEKEEISIAWTLKTPDVSFIQTAREEDAMDSIWTPKVPTVVTEAAARETPKSWKYKARKESFSTAMDISIWTPKTTDVSFIQTAREEEQIATAMDTSIWTPKTPNIEATFIQTAREESTPTWTLKSSKSEEKFMGTEPEMISAFMAKSEESFTLPTNVIEMTVSTPKSSLSMETAVANWSPFESKEQSLLDTTCSTAAWSPAVILKSFTPVSPSLCKKIGSRMEKRLAQMGEDISQLTERLNTARDEESMTSIVIDTCTPKIFEDMSPPPTANGSFIFSRDVSEALMDNFEPNRSGAAWSIDEMQTAKEIRQDEVKSRQMKDSKCKKMTVIEVLDQMNVMINKLEDRLRNAKTRLEQESSA